MEDIKSCRGDKIAPLPTIRRVPSYLRILYEYRANSIEWISATDIADRLSLKPIQVRKDMSFTGITGKPKKGFKVQELIESIRCFLGWDSTSDALIVGTGALGSALLGYSGFTDHGLKLVAAFDKNPDKIGTFIHGKQIFGMDQLNSLVSRLNIRIGILTVSGDGAQKAADAMVAAGIEGIWNFSPVKLQVPPCVVVQKEDLSSGLAVLSVRLGAKANDDKAE